MLSTPFRARQLAVLAGLLLIVLFHVAGNLYWITVNVTPLGRDAGGHLWRTLDFANVLHTWTPRTLFQALTLTNYRPPLLYVLVQPFYRLFGINMDAAQYLNVVLLGLILLVTFALGRRVFDDATALIAAALVGLWPMTAAMTRLFYMENLQTTMLLLILWTLLRTDFFASRRWSALWGLALGLGLLAKWTVPPLVALPVVWAAWRGGVWSATWQALRRPRLSPAMLGRALAVGTLATALIYWPNRDLVRVLPLGNTLILAWLLLWSATALAFLTPPRAFSNFWGGIFLAAAIASIWYLGRIDFVSGLLDAAFGTYGGNYGPFNPFRLRNYTRYPRYLVYHHWGLLGTVLVVLPTAWAWGRYRTRLASHADGARLLWLTVLSTYIALALPSQDSERNLVPLLPVLALLVAASLRALRGYAKGALVAALWLAVFGFQWASVTFDNLAVWRQRAPVLWAESEFAQPPASGPAHPGYWIAPDVLETMVRNSPPERPIVFGMLINSPTIHRGPYRYLIRTTYPDVELLPLTEDWSEGWRGTVRSLWLLTKDGDNHDVEPAGLRALHEVYENPDGFFPLLFEPVKRYPLPNGEVATLWRRTVGPPVQPPIAPSAEAASAGRRLGQWLNGWPLVVGTREDALWLALAFDLTPKRVFLASPEGPPPNASTLFAVLPPGGEHALPWLYQDYALAYSAWLESRLWTIWARQQPDAPMTQAHHTFGEVVLVGWRAPASAVHGSAVPVVIRWEGGPVNLKVSLRLVASDGQMVTQLDRELTPPETPVGLFVPPETQPGPYKLALVVYHPETGEPLVNQDGQPVTLLGEVYVTARSTD